MPTTYTPADLATLANMDKVTIGQLVKQTREKLDISHRELALRTKQSTRTLLQIEGAKSNYGIDTLAIVCQAIGLEVSVNHVKGRTVTNTPTEVAPKKVQKK